MKTIITITSIILLSIFSGSTASARGMLPPPPPYFSGGNAGDWLGSGPLFSGDEPWGFDFPDEWGDGGNEGGGIDPSGGYSGYFGPGGAKQDSLGVNFGCNKRCQQPTMTAGCLDICGCTGWVSFIDEPIQFGRCEPGRVTDERNRCGFHGGGCWYYKE